MGIKSNVAGIPTAKARFKREIPLVSGGYVNRSAFPDGKITVYPWGNDAEEFIVSKSRGKKKPGIVYDLFPRLCDLNGCPPGDFLASEALMILTVSRAITRNSTLKVPMECPECGHEWVEDIEVPAHLEQVGNKSDTYPGYDTFQLTDSKDWVKVKPLTVQDHRDLMARPQSLRVIPDHIAEALTAVQAVASTEDEVKGDEFKAESAVELYQWYLRLSPADATEFGKKLYEITPQLSGKLLAECKACQHVFDISINVDAEFFREGSRT